MARLIKFASTIAFALACLASVAAGETHRLCLQWGMSSAGSIFYDITVNDVITRLDRYDMSQNPPAFIGREDYAVLAKPNPPGSHWGDGVAYAANMQTRNAWVYPQQSQTSAGYWDVLSATEDRWRFQTVINGQAMEVTFTTANCATSPANPPGTTAPTPAQQTPQPPAPETTSATFQCGNQGNVHCNAGDTCCYHNLAVINPFCIAAGSTDKCCRWGYDFSRYQSATRCRADQECCDIPNANGGDTHAGYCCDSGTTCCKSMYQPQTFGNSACCPLDGKCCQGYTHGFCCAAGDTCDVSNHVCVPPSQQTESPNSPAPTVTAPPPPAPTPVYTAASGTHRVCNQWGFSGAGSVFYDITTDMAQTVMVRYDMSKNPPLLIDTNMYAALAEPNPPGSFWGDGVAFAATMQTRNAWGTNEQTTGAYWDIIGQGQDKWRFETTLYGSPFTVTFTTETCATSPKNSS